MPYKDKNSEAAKESRRRRAANYYARHKEKCIASVLNSRAKDPSAYNRAQEKFQSEHPTYSHDKAVERYAKDGEQIRETRKKYYSEHGEQERAYTRNHYAQNREEILEKQKASPKRKEYHKKYYRELKRRVIEGYGGKCECCSIDTFEFLTIDHIHGGGHRERKAKTGAGFYAGLERAGFPKEKYRLLCINCNFSFGMYGYCPHKFSATVLPSVPEIRDRPASP